MWPSLLKIQYTELKLLCRNDPVVKNSIYSNSDLWPNDPKIIRILPLPRGNHLANFGKDLIYRTKVIVRKPVWTPAIPNHIIRTVSRWAYNKNEEAIAVKGICFEVFSWSLKRSWEKFWTCLLCFKKTLKKIYNLNFLLC